MSQSTEAVARSTEPSAARPRDAGERWRTHERYLYLLAKLVFIGLVAALGLRVLQLLSTVLMPALIGLALAYVFDPLIDRLEARRINRSVAIGVVAVVMVMALATLVLVIVPAFVDQFRVTMERLPLWAEDVYRRGAELLRDRLGFSVEEVNAATRRALAGAQATIMSVITGVGGSAKVVVNTLLIPIFFFYFLRDFDRIKRKPLSLIPPRFYDYVISRAGTMDAVVGHWLRGQIQVALVLATLYAAGLWLEGVRLGVVIGVVTGLFNIIPYVGSALGITLSVLMVLIEHEGMMALAGVAGVFLVVLCLDTYLITPRLVGAKVGMHPLVVILVVLVGGALFGVLGMLLAVPLAAAAGVLLKDVLARYRASRFFLEGSPP